MGVVTAIALIGLAVATVGTVASAKAARDQSRFQSQVAQQQATRAEQVSEVNAAGFKSSTDRAIAAARTRLLAGGGTLSGSSLLSLEDFAEEAEVDRLNIRQGGDINATRLRQQADLFQSSGKNAQTAGFIRAGSQLLTGVSSVGAFGGGGDKGVSDSAKVTSLQA